MASHRVLRLTFEFHVPEGLRANIRAARIEAAVAGMRGAVQSLAPSLFPWADRIVVRHDWSYRWIGGEDLVISLPATTENTVTVPLSTAEEAQLLIQERQ